MKRPIPGTLSFRIHVQVFPPQHTILLGIILALFFFSPFSVDAAPRNYYIDAVVGIDTNDGTLAAPWRTLYKAFTYSNATGYNPGDQILLKRGQDHYGGNNNSIALPTIKLLGTKELPITIGAYGPVTYDATGEETNRPIVRMRVSTTTPDQWEPTGVPGVWEFTTPTFSTEYLWENDIPLKKASTLECLNGQGTNCPDGNWYHYSELCTGCVHVNTLYYRPTTGSLGSQVHYGRYGQAVFNDTSNVIFRDLEFRASAVPISIRAENSRVENITLENSVFYAVAKGLQIKLAKFGGSGLYVRHNKFIYTLESVEVADQGNPAFNITDGEVAYNHSIDSNKFNFWGGDQEHYYIQNPNYFHYHHNIVEGGQAAAMDNWYGSWFGGTAIGNLWEYNLIKNIHGNQSQNSENNRAVTGWHLGAGPEIDTCYGNVSRYNVIIDVDVGMSLVGCLVNTKPPNQVYNNTLIGNGIGIRGRGAMRDWVVRNNIVINPSTTAYLPAGVPTGTSPGVHFLYETPQRAGTYPYPFTSGNNLYYPDGPNLFQIGSNHYDLKGWQGVTGQDTTSFAQDPKLVNVSAGDARLTANSPTINRGVSLAGTQDFLGNPIVGAPDIGAYEYQGQVATDTVAPTTPANLAAIIISSSQINLTWSAATDNIAVTGYNIYRNNVLISSVANTSYKDTGLALSTAYTYKVVAIDSSGNISSPSSPVSVTTSGTATLDTTAPSYVTVVVPFEGRTISGTYVISANAGDNVGIAGMQFKLDGVNLGPEFTTTPYSFSWDTKTTSNGTHILEVVARDAAGNKTTSSPRTFSVSNTTGTSLSPDITPPAIPENITATVMSPSEIRLTWKKSPDVATPGEVSSGTVGYKVFRCTGTTCTPTVQIATSTTSFGPYSTDLAYYNNIGLLSSATYRYGISAFDTKGNTSAPSIIVSVTPASPDITPPPTPQNLAVTGASTSGVSLTWSPSTDPLVAGQTTSGISGYRLYRNGIQAGTSPTASFNHIADKGTSFITGQRYNYTVQAVDGAGNLSAQSSILSVTIPITPVVVPSIPTATSTPSTNIGITSNTDNISPPTPENFRGSALSPTQTRLTWNPVTDASGILGYRIKRGDILFVYVPTSFFEEAGLTPNTTYTYTVEAIDGAGNNSTPATITLTTPTTGAQTATSSPTLTTPTPQPLPSPTTTAALQGPFGIGYRNDQVKLLQEMLIKDGLLGGEATGYYGPLTTQAVQKFQTKYGIVTSGTPSTTGYGLAGPGTRAKLNQLYGGSGGTTDQEALIASLRKQVADLTALLQTLIDKLAALKAGEGIE